MIPLVEISHHRVCFYWKEGVLYRKWSPEKSGQHDVFEDVGPQVQELHQVVVPKVARDTVLGLAHDIPLAGHLGVEKTKSRVLRHYNWPGVFQGVAMYCRTCETSQKSAKKNPQKRSSSLCAICSQQVGCHGSPSFSILRHPDTVII